MKKLGFWLCVFGLIAPLSANATTLTLNKLVIQQISSDVDYGGCYAVLSQAIGGACKGKTVSFDCDGKFNTNGAGSRHYSTALLAFSLNKSIALVVDDAKQYSGYCVATRVSLTK